MAAGSTARLFLDANVLIDYLQSGRAIFDLVRRHLGEVHVVSLVLGEVDGLDLAGCRRLGIEVVEPELAQLIAAGQARGPLSLPDHLCLAIAKERGWTCVSNDKALRRACQHAGVSVLWGLELMLELARLGELASDEALSVAQKIHAANPFSITAGVVDAFRAKLREIKCSPRSRPVPPVA